MSSSEEKNLEWAAGGLLCSCSGRIMGSGTRPGRHDGGFFPMPNVALLDCCCDNLVRLLRVDGNLRLLVYQQGADVPGLSAI
jgi:hypothetical protein